MHFSTISKHSIGGSNSADFVNIFPIIQWLVKKVIETREETGDLMRLFSESQFDKSFQLPEDKAFEEQIGASIKFVANLHKQDIICIHEKS